MKLYGEKTLALSYNLVYDKEKLNLNAIDFTLLSFKDASHFNAQMLHHLCTSSSVFPQIFFNHLLTDIVN